MQKSLQDYEIGAINKLKWNVESDAKCKYTSATDQTSKRLFIENHQVT